MSHTITQTDRGSRRQATPVLQDKNTVFFQCSLVSLGGAWIPASVTAVCLFKLPMYYAPHTNPLQTS